jgi:olfactory receptor
MEGRNHPMLSEFEFLGLTNTWEIQLLIFAFSSTFYVASIMGN